jgi:hypothetical protein
MFIRCWLGIHEWGDWKYAASDKYEERVCGRCHTVETRALHQVESEEENTDFYDAGKSISEICPVCDGEGLVHNVGDPYDRYYGLTCPRCGGSGHI